MTKLTLCPARGQRSMGVHSPGGAPQAAQSSNPGCTHSSPAPTWAPQANFLGKEQKDSWY